MWYCVMGFGVLGISKERSAFFQGSSHWSFNMEAPGSSIVPRITYPVAQYQRKDLNPQEEQGRDFVVGVTQYSRDANDTQSVGLVKVIV